MEEVKRWRVGDGTIRLTKPEAQWLISQPGTPALIWPTEDQGTWAGEGFTTRNGESTS